jgi:hypothetical protein
LLGDEMECFTVGRNRDCLDIAHQIDVEHGPGIRAKGHGVLTHPEAGT